MNVNSERKYVIVCNEHIGTVKDALLFWGSLTDDNRETSPQEVAFHILVSWNSRMIQDCADLKYEMQKLKESKNDE